MFLFQVSQTHHIAVYEKGTPGKEPIFYLHGGPGGSVSEKSFSFFDLANTHVIAFDQRGSGKSEPFLSLEDNTVFASVEDIEKLRIHYGFDKITLFGGSYGTTLALCYAIKYPKHIERMILRGIFLGRKSDIDWLYQEGASYFYPKEHQHFKNYLPLAKRNHIIAGYYEIFMSGKQEKIREAAKIWSDWENSLISLNPLPLTGEIQPGDISMALLECHYFYHHMFWPSDSYILDHVACIKDLKIDIVHGRFDVDCRVSGAYELYRHLNNANLHIIQQGSHNPYEKEIFNKLKELVQNPR